MVPHFLLRKIGKYDTNLRSHKMVLSNYEGKMGNIMGVIQVNVTVKSIIRPTIFIVITSKAGYNLLLGREWIPYIRGCVIIAPSEACNMEE